MAPEKAEYAEGEHETMLRQLDALHHETRAETLARLKAAIAADKSPASPSPLATRTEAVTREVTIGPPEVKEADTPAEKAAKKRAKKAKKAQAAKPVNKQVLPAKAE